MKKITKAEQRKLYKMYRESVDSEASSLITLKSMSSFSLPSHDDIQKDAQKKKDEFLKLLEDGIE